MTATRGDADRHSRIPHSRTRAARYRSLPSARDHGGHLRSRGEPQPGRPPRRLPRFPEGGAGPGARRTETIVVDNASADNSRELVRARGGRDADRAAGEPGLRDGGRGGQARWHWGVAAADQQRRAHRARRSRRAVEGGPLWRRCGVGGRPDALRQDPADHQLGRAGGGPPRGRLRSPARGAGVGSGGDQLEEVFGASGGAALYRASMLEEIGGFDPASSCSWRTPTWHGAARMGGWRCLYPRRPWSTTGTRPRSGHRSSIKHYHVGRNRIRLMAKNADAGLLRRYGAAMVAYDIFYVIVHAVIDRTLAPARGRLAGLREWRGYRPRGAAPPRGAPARPRRARRACARARQAGRATRRRPAMASAARRSKSETEAGARPRRRPQPAVDLLPVLRTLAVLDLGGGEWSVPNLETVARVAGWHGDVEVVVPGRGGAAKPCMRRSRGRRCSATLLLSFWGAAGDHRLRARRRLARER